ncbi:MAG: hypothetical protein EPN86_03560, partial [Nanoarchaeota archaeon]
MSTKPSHIVPKYPPLIIAITGTPASGKTYLAKKLSLLMKGTYVNLNSLAVKGGLKAGYDKNRQAVIIDEKGLYEAL